jgi:hypothetical protein
MKLGPIEISATEMKLGPVEVSWQARVLAGVVAGAYGLARADNACPESPPDVFATLAWPGQNHPCSVLDYRNDESGAAALLQCSRPNPYHFECVRSHKNDDDTNKVGGEFCFAHTHGADGNNNFQLGLALHHPDYEIDVISGDTRLKCSIPLFWHSHRLGGFDVGVNAWSECKNESGVVVANSGAVVRQARSIKGRIRGIIAQAGKRWEEEKLASATAETP